MKTRNLIDEFLSHKRFAFVGASRKSNDFSRLLLREFLQKGYDPVPVNPHATEIEGKPCYPSVAEITPGVTAALLLNSSDTALTVVRDCAQAGISLIWAYGISGPNNISSDIVAACERHGIKLVPGYCPLMFFGETAWYHRWHGKLMKLTGGYPS